MGAFKMNTSIQERSPVAFTEYTLQRTLEKTDRSELGHAPRGAAAEVRRELRFGDAEIPMIPA